MRWRILFCAAWCFVVPSFLMAASEEAEVYFNSGTEKYLQGRLTEAVEDLEKARALEPGNKKTGEFIVRILLEASTQAHLAHRYQEAYKYLEKAISIAPDDGKVREMYALTGSLLNKPRPQASQESLLPTETPPPAVPAPALRGRPGKPAAPAPARKEKAPPFPAANASPGAASAAPKESLPARGLTVPFPAAVAAASVCFILCVVLLAQAAAFKRARRRGAAAGEKYALLQDEQQRLLIEVEKLREQSKYEHEAAERLRAELREKKRKEDELLRAELGMQMRQVEDRIKKDLSRGHPSKNEEFLRQQQAKLMEYVENSFASEEGGSPAIEAMRERIALMAENLHSYAPGAAVDFLNKMARDGNPLVRANIVRALARLSTPEALEILFGLSDDADHRVQREVIKHLRQLHHDAAGGDTALAPDLREKVNELLARAKQRGEWIM
ncbi:MAG: HEAT repeat domain-containing protein [Endomicrobiales bacterium]